MRGQVEFSKGWDVRAAGPDQTFCRQTSQVKLSALSLIMTVRLLTPFLIVIPAILLGLYQIRLKPLLEVGGVWKEIQDVGRELKETCAYVDQLKGCERKPAFGC